VKRARDVTINSIIQFLTSARTRGRDSNISACVASELGLLKQDFVRHGNQEQAKFCWCLGRVLECQNHFLSAFENMKAGRFYKAWCDFAECEKQLRLLHPHLPFDDFDFSLKFIETYVARYQSLFPYEWFVSSEFLINEFQCSICGKRMLLRNPCGHKVGEIYDGELCCRVVKGVELLGVAFVKSPLDKTLVPFASRDSGEMGADTYDYSLVKFLAPNLRSPFDTWEVERTTRPYPHSKFSALGRNDRCPCGSGKKYKRCCLDKPEVLMPHCVFRFPDASNNSGFEQ
jgi:hypothetical protein